MKSRISAIVGIGVLLAVVAWLMTRPGDAPPAPSKTPEIAPSAPVEAPVVAPATAAVPSESVAPSVPLPVVQPPAPKPRSGASRAASLRDLADPLVAADIPQGMPPPRRVVDVIPEAAPDFDKIALMFREYRTLTGENPVGTNAEIMKAIMGDNPKGAKLGPPEGQNVNPNGELIDRWGTPYFFHQLTKDRMEIRSAGPDRILWNEDDLIGD